ncbi:leucine-rich repeat domain-containing protein [Flavobacterium sp. P21]|uniref:leucine-rich repeat domain-containing protein n=1 Tax=Flavobacterium sp. P21 TaxID=3423948 RepID=UPI003D66E1B7
MKTKLLLLFSLITFSNFAQTVPSYVPKSGLIGYYPFDNNANDISGNLNNGTVNGAVLTQDRTGKSNSAYSFDGISNYIDVNVTNIPQGNAARTISGWFKTNTPNSGENGDVSIFNYGSLSRLRRFGLTIYSKGYLQTTTGPNQVGDDFYVNNFNYLSNDWYFFTLTYNGTKVSLYVNGVLASEKAANLSTLNNIFRIGKRISGDTTNEYFKGTIDDIGIWNRALTSQEILAMYVDAPERLDLYTLIPDANFEQKLIELGIDTDGKNGKVLTNNIKNVKSLEIDTRTVADLTGIEGFTALETLVCSGKTAIRFEGGDGKLTTLDVSKNLNLKTLDCNSNQLTNLDVSKNPDLRTLNINGNKITSIDVTKNLYLYKLSTSLNPLTTIDVSKNLNLNILDVSGTKLTEIDVSQDIALTNLNISGINIPTIDVSQNINLTSLYCDGTNSLTSLDLSKNTKLYALSCTYNKITSLDLSKNLALTRLFCESNQLTTLDVSKNTALTELNFSDNKISSIDISKCTSLTNLNCTNNLLTDVNLSANTKLDKAILDKNSFTTLDVSKNTALKTLWCGENQLTSITLPESNTLEVLYLNSNKFTALDISKYTALKEFVCSTNQLTAIDVSKNTALTFFIAMKII